MRWLDFWSFLFNVRLAPSFYSVGEVATPPERAPDTKGVAENGPNIMPRGPVLQALLCPSKNQDGAEIQANNNLFSFFFAREIAPNLPPGCMSTLPSWTKRTLQKHCQSRYLSNANNLALILLLKLALYWSLVCMSNECNVSYLPIPSKSTFFFFLSLFLLLPVI